MSEIEGSSRSKSSSSKHQKHPKDRSSKEDRDRHHSSSKKRSAEADEPKHTLHKHRRKDKDRDEKHRDKKHKKSHREKDDGMEIIEDDDADVWVEKDVGMEGENVSSSNHNLKYRSEVPIS